MIGSTNSLVIIGGDGETSQNGYFFPNVYSKTDDWVWEFSKNIKQVLVVSTYGLIDNSIPGQWAGNTSTPQAFYSEGKIWFNWGLFNGTNLNNTVLVSTTGSYVNNAYGGDGIGKIEVNNNKLTLKINLQNGTYLYNYSVVVITE